MARIPFYLVTGFLGSGKTTLVSKVLERHSHERKIAVVQNEFSAGMADGDTLKRSGKEFSLLEINNGSVFCVCLLGSFVKSLQSFVDEHRPDLLLMEASGLSDPISIGEMLNSKELGSRLYLGHIWSIVDAVNFHSLAMNQTRIRHQVSVADTVLVNKCDLLPGADTTSIHNKIREMNPFASVADTSWCEVPLNLDPVPYGMAPVAVRQEALFAGLERSGRPDIGSEVVKESKAISREGLEAFLEEWAPRLWRIKGTVRLEGGGGMAVQSSFGDCRTGFLPGYEAPTELIGIGPDLDNKGFPDQFRRFLAG